MSFIDKIKEQAKLNKKTIVLPEGEDSRVVEAALKVASQDIANIIILGTNKIDAKNITVINPKDYENKQEFAEKLYELRKEKGMTIEEANKLMNDNTYFGMMMVKLGYADGLVSGACHSTSDTLRPALQILKTKPGTKLVSTCSVMEVPNCEYGENGLFVFSDCGLNQNPNAEELAEIAISSSKSFEKLIGKPSKVAMLSYSTLGSSVQNEMIEKVSKATKLVKEKCPELIVDGEMQLDCAIIPEVAKIKAPNSIIQGDANTLIFPDLNAGNIGYKLVDRLAKANSYGPICQGIAKPINDLSRGASVDDIVGVIAITALQANNE